MAFRIMLRAASLIASTAAFQGAQYRADTHSAALSEAGYGAVVSLGSDQAMKNFIKKFLEAEGKEVTSESDLDGLVPWFSGTKATQSFAQMKVELSRKPWVAMRRIGSRGLGLRTLKSIASSVNLTFTSNLSNSSFLENHAVINNASECDFGCYLARYPDLAANLGSDVVKAKKHWENFGQHAGRVCTCGVAAAAEKPAAACNWGCYLRRYKDLSDAFGRNETLAKLNWELEGRPAGRNCGCDASTSHKATDINAGCNWGCYIARYPDLKSQYGTDSKAKWHWEHFGHQAGRDCTCAADTTGQQADHSHHSGAKATMADKHEKKTDHHADKYKQKIDEQAASNKKHEHHSASKHGKHIADTEHGEDQASKSGVYQQWDAPWPFGGGGSKGVPDVPGIPEVDKNDTATTAVAATTTVATTTVATTTVATTVVTTSVAITAATTAVATTAAATTIATTAAATTTTVATTTVATTTAATTTVATTTVTTTTVVTTEAVTTAAPEEESDADAAILERALVARDPLEIQAREKAPAGVKGAIGSVIHGVVSKISGLFQHSDQDSVSEMTKTNTHKAKKDTSGKYPHHKRDVDKKDTSDDNRSDKRNSDQDYAEIIAHGGVERIVTQKAAESVKQYVEHLVTEKTKACLGERNITFQPGTFLGIGADWSAGTVINVVNDSQALHDGVQAGWMMNSVDGQPYTERLFDDKKTGNREFTITFKVPCASVNDCNGDCNLRVSKVHHVIDRAAAPRQASELSHRAVELKAAAPHHTLAIEKAAKVAAAPHQTFSSKEGEAIMSKVQHQQEAVADSQATTVKDDSSEMVRLASTEEVLSKPSNLFSKLNAQIGELRAHIEEAENAGNREAMTKKAEYHALLEAQRTNSSQMRQANAKLKAEIEALMDKNHELRTQAEHLRTHSRGLRTEIDAFAQNMSTVLEFIDVSLQVDPELEDKTTVLRELEQKEHTESEELLHKARLKQVMGALLQVDEMPNNKEARAVVSTIGNKFNDLAVQQEAGLTTLRETFETELKDETDIQLQLMQEHGELAETKDSAIELQEQLEAAVMHLEKSKTVMQSKLDGMRGYAAELSEPAY